MKKKILLTLIAVFMSLFAVGVINVSAESYGDLTYKVENGEVSITDCKEDVTSVTIPAEIEGYPVTGIGYAAFEDCICLTDVEISDSVTSIGNAAFARCKSLTEITIPDSVTSAGKAVLMDCKALTQVTLGSGLTIIKDSFFRNCISLTNIIIPEGVKTIAFEAFRNCQSLYSITIPKSVKTIERNAFYNSENLEKLYYTGSKTNWNSINIVLPYTNSELLKAEKIFDYNPLSAIAEITNATSTSNSLKFMSEVSIEGEPKISTFGTTFIPLWLFETGSANVATVQYDNSIYNIQDGQTFGATLNGIPESAKDMEIVGKSFVKDADGNYTWSAAKSASVNDTTLVELK